MRVNVNDFTSGHEAVAFDETFSQIRNGLLYTEDSKELTDVWKWIEKVRTATMTNTHYESVCDFSGR